MEKKVRELVARLVIVEEMLGRSDILADQKAYRALAQEHSYLREVAQVWENLQKSRQQLTENKTHFRTEQDPEFAALLN